MVRNKTRLLVIRKAKEDEFHGFEKVGMGLR